MFFSFRQELLMKIPEASWKRIRLIHIFILCDFFWPFALLTLLCSLWHSLQVLVVCGNGPPRNASFSLPFACSAEECAKKKHESRKLCISTESLWPTLKSSRNAKNERSEFMKRSPESGLRKSCRGLLFLVTACAGSSRSYIISQSRSSRGDPVDFRH